MQDREIVQLFLARDENAIGEAASKYRVYCHAIARQILQNEEEAEEVLNDTWLGAWNSIPPHEPENLGTYLGRITRNLSLTKRRDRHAAKRYGDTVSLAEEELAECLPGGKTVEEAVEEAELKRVIDGFVGELPDIEQRVFVCRYYYFDSTSDMAERFSFSESKVRFMLHRIRKKLRKRLEEEEIWL